ncbi:hypothetical protein FACS1894187_20150 [Synergistales bacterium]|nr:hypothetical protein FACS1894187_20150 [Synergistales bacterium]
MSKSEETKKTSAAFEAEQLRDEMVEAKRARLKAIKEAIAQEDAKARMEAVEEVIAEAGVETKTADEEIAKAKLEIAKAEAKVKAAKAKVEVAEVELYKVKIELKTAKAKLRLETGLAKAGVNMREETAFDPEEIILAKEWAIDPEKQVGAKGEIIELAKRKLQRTDEEVPTGLFDFSIRPSLIDAETRKKVEDEFFAEVEAAGRPWDEEDSFNVMTELNIRLGDLDWAMYEEAKEAKNRAIEAEAEELVAIALKAIEDIRS